MHKVCSAVDWQLTGNQCWSLTGYGSRFHASLRALLSIAWISADSSSRKPPMVKISGVCNYERGLKFKLTSFRWKIIFRTRQKQKKNVSFLIPVIKNCWLPAISSFQSTFTTKLPVDIPCRVIMPSFIFCLTALAHHIGHRFSLSSAHSAQRGFCCVINMKSCIICYYYYYYYYTLFLRK